MLKIKISSHLNKIESNDHVNYSISRFFKMVNGHVCTLYNGYIMDFSQWISSHLWYDMGTACIEHLHALFISFWAQLGQFSTTGYGSYSSL